MDNLWHDRETGTVFYLSSRFFISTFRYSVRFSWCWLTIGNYNNLNFVIHESRLNLNRDCSKVEFIGILILFFSYIKVTATINV